MILISFSLSTLILLVALFLDLKTKKIPNLFILISLVLIFLFFAFTYKEQNFMSHALGWGTALLLSLPLYLVGGLGGGDVKLLTSFGLLHNVSLVLEVFIYSLFWAVVFGLIMITIKGNLKMFFDNIRTLNLRPEVSHKIPFTFPLFLAWLSYSLVSLRGIL